MAEESETSAVCSSAENWWNGVSTGSGSGSGSGSCSSLMFNILQQPHASSENLNWSSCTSTSIPTSVTEEIDNLSSTNNHTTTSSTLSTMDSGGLSQQDLVDSASLLEQHMNINMGHFATPHAHNPNIWTQVLLSGGGGGGGGSGSSESMRSGNNFEEPFYSRALRQEIADSEHLKKIEEDVPTGWELRNQIASSFDINMNLKTHIPTPSGFVYDSNATSLPDLGTWTSDLNMAQFDVGRIKKEYPMPSSLGVSLTNTQLLQGYGGDSNFKNDSSFCHILESRPFMKAMGDEYASRWASNSSGCLSQSVPSSSSKAGVLNFGNMGKQVLDFSKSDLMKKQNERSIQFYHDGKQAHALPSQHRTMPHGDEARDSTTDTKRSRCTDQTTGDTIFKRPRLENSSTVPAFKVRKEKLGDRITALQQLVSPFGKTDTASVLLEAIGYIKFLQEQVQVLSTPYMKSGGPIPSQGVQDQKGRVSSDKKDTDEPKQDLRSRGLCLVPVSCTLHVANDNGADYWTPSIGGTYR